MAVRSRKGPYRYLVRRWDRIADLDLARQLIQSEFFHGELDPQPLPLEKIQSILVLAPHQDDEAIGAGGTLALAAELGIRLHILYVTDGATANPPYAQSKEESIEVRRQEAQDVCKALNASYHELGIDNVVPKPNQTDVERLQKFIHDLNPDVLLTPSPLDLPAKHRMVNHLLWLALYVQPPKAMEVWGYQVHSALFPNAYVDITAVAEQKRQLIATFASQVVHSQAYDHMALGLAAWNSHVLKPSPEPRYVELFFTQPCIEFLALIQRLYFQDFWKTYRGHPQVMEAMQALHQKAVEG